MKRYVVLFILILFVFHFDLSAQKFTHQDTLRGSITKERAWWDLLHYNLNVKVNAQQQTISGSNTITYRVIKNHQVMQIDLQEPLKILNITQNKSSLAYTKDGNAYFIQLKENQVTGDKNKITIYYKGKPLESINPPWSGGFTWKKDKNKNDFIATTCQGIGASIWWPCKDHLYDQPDDGASIVITAPQGLMDVSNGRLKKVIENSDKTKTFFWEVVNPINNYGINVNIADYRHFSEKYQGEKGILDCDYYVLPYNLEKAKKQFQQVPKMLEAFEHWFGPYPFYEDGYKLVEVPYLGMEHQSSVTYGNRYQNGYLGRDLSESGWGMKFDFIIIHESGHEWFANNITYRDVADMWIHESFTAYSETLYLDYHYGKEAGNNYLIGTRNKILNDKAIIGKYDVNYEGSTDMYYKGSNMIHTLRQMINDDKKFRSILRGLNKTFYHQTVSTRQIENFISQKSGLDLTAFFNQYLRTTDIPVLEYKIKKSTIRYRFNKTVKGFSIPVKVRLDHQEKWIYPTSGWQELEISDTDVTFNIDRNFYIIISKLN